MSSEMEAAMFMAMFDEAAETLKRAIRSKQMHDSWQVQREAAETLKYSIRSEQMHEHWQVQRDLGVQKGQYKIVKPCICFQSQRQGTSGG